GARMGPNVDKLFLEVAGRPVIVHTWSRFDSCSAVDEIVLVIREGMAEAFHEIARHSQFTKPHRFVTGGKERQDSVWNRFEGLPPQAEIVAIQDGARPCTSHALITATIQAARECGAAVAAQRVSDTIKEGSEAGVIIRNVERSRLWSVQTPQTFQ